MIIINSHFLPFPPKISHRKRTNEEGGREGRGLQQSVSFSQGSRVTTVVVVVGVLGCVVVTVNLLPRIFSRNKLN